jgi:signal transduction histidine kinase
MRLPIRLRLSLSFLVVLLLGIALAVALTWIAVERLYLNTLKENLLAQAELAAAALQGASLPIESSQPYLQTRNIAPGIHTRLLSQSGAVVVGLPAFEEDQLQQVPPAESAGFIPAESLRQRPEVVEALTGLSATAVRRVDSAGSRVLYAAAPLWDEDFQVAGIVYLATPLPRVGLPVTLLVQILATVLVATALAGFTGTRLARGIARPIETLDSAAAAVTDGDLSQIAEDGSGIPELARLNRSFNEMVASLHRSDQVKNAFIADVTHELRTPLTVIKGTVETLLDGALDDLEGRLPLLTAMEGETDRLIRLVNDLLVLTRADANVLQLKDQPLDLAAVARSRCQVLTPLAEDRGISLCIGDFAPKEVFWVQADPDRLAQVLDNLLDNAIRHAPVGSKVNVRLYQETEVVFCEVVDQGPGIPPQHLPHLFERFYRVDSSRDRRTGGTGLGLTIAQALLTAQGGGITVTSKLGEGSAFIFWLPTAELPQD